MNTKVNDIKNNIKKVIVGNDNTIDYVLTSFLCGGHCLLEDVPGTGKTMLAKSLAASIDAGFSRIQFTPDLLPSDITGIYYYDKKSADFVFRQGPLFADIVLGDEINRATPRTQSALLECMAEKQVTIEGNTHELSPLFFVIATENPIETQGTFPLPEAQLDRFMMKLSMEKPDRLSSLTIMKRYNTDNPLSSLTSVCTTEDILTMRKNVSEIFVADSLANYILDIADTISSQPDVVLGISTRAALDLLHASKAYAYIKGRRFVIPEDIKALAPKVFAHRIILSRGGGQQTQKAAEIINRVLSLVAVPTENWSRD